MSSLFFFFLFQTAPMMEMRTDTSEEQIYLKSCRLSALIYHFHFTVFIIPSVWMGIRQSYINGSFVQRNLRFLFLFYQPLSFCPVSTLCSFPAAHECTCSFSTSVFTLVCWGVWLRFSRITQKLHGGFSPNLVEGFSTGQGKPHSILGQICGT